MVDVVESNRSMMVDVVESNRSAAAEEEREAETKAAEVDFEEEGEGGDSLYAAQTSRFRDTWISLYSRYFGHFEDTSELFLFSSIRSMEGICR